MVKKKKKGGLHFHTCPPPFFPLYKEEEHKNSSDSSTLQVTGMLSSLQSRNWLLQATWSPFQKLPCSLILVNHPFFQGLEVIAAPCELTVG